MTFAAGAEPVTRGRYTKNNKMDWTQPRGRDGLPLRPRDAQALRHDAYVSVIVPDCGLLRRIRVGFP